MNKILLFIVTLVLLTACNNGGRHVAPDAEWADAGLMLSVWQTSISQHRLWADKLGVKAYFGVEITMAKHDNVHILLYGINPEFLLEYPDLYDYELKDLSELAHKYNSILIQAHPFRSNCNVLQDLNYLDGIEANCHTIKEGPHLELVSNIAKEYKKILTCGGDFHNDASRAKCGVYLPEDLNDIMDIVNYLKQENEIKLCVQLGKSQETVIDYIFSKI
jgi:hypothetical protein